MELIISETASLSKSVIETIWFPLILWTLMTGLVLMVMKLFGRLHSQYHYHTRLALILALPFGILASWFFQYISTVSEASYVIISVMSPVEVVVSEQAAESGFSVLEILYAGTSLLFLFGLLYFAGRYIFQWLQLFVFKNNEGLQKIETITGIDKNTLELAKSTRKSILLGFSAHEIIPVTFGAFRPVILLPASIRDNQTKLNLAIRHELTHISQNDFSTHLLVTAIKSFFWFHPLVHVLAHQIADFREMRCDSLVLADRSVSKKEYATLLLELLPSQNLNQEISVNMAQESSNLKKRIQMMKQHQLKNKIPGHSSFTLLSVLLAAVVLAMACTDMQSHNAFDEEELNLMTDVDRSGERGYHQIIIFMGEDGQDERHRDALAQLDRLQPEHIREIEVLKGEAAIALYGERGSEGVILIKTQQSLESYNATLQALGMNPVDPESFEGATEKPQDFFVVVEEMPELIGGLEELQQNIRYPETARRAGIEGRVYVQFIVDENGDVQNPEVIRGIGGGADEEAVRAVKLAKFKPGMQRGRPVRVQYSLPIFFRLSGTSAENPEVSEKSIRIENLVRSGDTVQGTVFDAATSQPMAGANIRITGTDRGSATDQDGNFSISGLDTNSSQIQISYVGYKTAVMDL